MACVNCEGTAAAVIACSKKHIYAASAAILSSRLQQETNPIHTASPANFIAASNS